MWWAGGHAYPPKDELIESQDRAMSFAREIVAARSRS
jgi:hypothetical protein